MIAVIFILLLVASTAEATTYYVATTGSDSNNGTSIDTPKLTIQACVDLMIAGDTCYVRGGTYTAQGIRFRVSGTSGSPISLLNYPNEAPVLSCTGTTLEANSILLMNGTSYKNPIGWIVVGGFEVTNCRDGIKWYNLNDTILRNNYIHDNINQGMLGVGSLRVTIRQNKMLHNGPHATNPSDFQAHGIYANGTDVVITNNVLVDSTGFGIQIDGTKSYTVGGTYASPELAGLGRWIISDNTIAYMKNRGAIVIWGGTNDGLRIENNIFYENNVNNAASEAQGISYISATGSTGVLIKNNFIYGSGSGATASTSGTAPADVTFTGNVVNTSAPAFVNGGSNSLPASPDFRLTASSPVNIATPNEFLNNGIVGAFKTTPTPTASINGQTVTYTFSSTTPILIPSSTGASINCTGSDCPGPLTVGSASVVPGADTQAAVVINGIPSNACVGLGTDPDQAWTGSYNSATGSWTSSDNIGPAPGMNQRLFSFTGLAITNNCDGTGPGGGVGTPIIKYDFNEGTGTTAANTGSSGSGDNGTLVNGATWTSGKTGTAVNVTGGTQQVQVPYTPGDPTTTSQTWVLAVNIPSGSESSVRYDIGTQIGTNQRLYVGAVDGTWRVATQSTSITATGSSNLTVTTGWQLLCLNLNAATDIATLYKDNVAGTGGATRSYTSFTPTGDILIGLTGTGFPSTVTPVVYDDFALYESVENCADIYNDWNAQPAAVGMFGMPAYRFQAVYLPELGGSPTNFGTAINQAKSVIAGGAVALLAEIYCENVTDCEQDGFRWEAKQNGAGSYIQIPDMETATHIWMWGQDNNTLLNAGITTSRLSAGSCTVTNGVTMLTSAQVPVINLPQDGCVVLRGIFRVGATASGYYDIRLSQQNGTAFTGTVNPARINVIPPQANAGP